MIFSQLRRQDWPMVGYFAPHWSSKSARRSWDGLDSLGPVDGFEVGGHFLAFFPGRELQRVTNHGTMQV